MLLCRLGAERLVIGYDVYRLPTAGAPPGGWAPADYASGWVAYVAATPGADGRIAYVDQAEMQPDAAAG